MTRVVYICGSQRSGSTLLGRLLGSIEGITFAGEVRNLWRGILGGATCGCGRPHRECELWSKVLDPDLGVGGLKPHEIMPLQEAAVPSRHGWRKTWGYLHGPELDPSTPAGRYASLVASVYERMAGASGATVVVDSSKQPAEAALFRRVPDLEVSVVQLVRDPRGMVLSHLKRGNEARSAWRRKAEAAYLSMGWLGRQLASQGVRRSAGDAGLLVRYEDYVEAPAEVLSEIAADAGVSDPSPPVSGNRAKLAPGHGPRGLRRFPEGTLVLGVQDDWRRELHSLDRDLVTAMTLPLLRAYGYPVRV
jgi:Sulfotransferase family